MSSPAPLPKWLPEALKARQHETAKASPDAVEDSPSAVARATTYLRNVRPAIEGQGGDAHTFATLCAVRDLNVSETLALELALEHFNPRCEPSWEPDELETKVANAYRYGQNEPGAWAVGDMPAEWDAVIAAAAAEERKPGITFKQASADYPPPFAMADLAAGSFPPVRYAVQKLILLGLVNLLYGDGGAGKTMLALNLAVAIALGRDVWGLGVRKMPVLLVLAEDDYGPTKERLEAICALFDCTMAELPITVWCLPGHDLRIAHVQDDGTWTPGPFLEPLRAKLTEIGPCFLVLDTVSDFATLDENKRQPVSTFCKVVLTGLCRAHGVTALVNAHPSKAAMSDGTHYAGSTAWNSAVRQRLSLTREPGNDPRRVLKVEKSNYGQGYELDLFQVGMTFGTRVQTDGTDREAALLNSAVRVALMAAEAGAPLTMQRRLNKWQLDEIARDVGRRPSNTEAKDALASALPKGLLRYVRGSALHAAGYYPSDEHVADELARQVRKMSGGEADA